jgi:TetR/AcrR family transcriptional regulator, ethionamide resistance regulator
MSGNPRAASPRRRSGEPTRPLLRTRRRQEREETRRQILLAADAFLRERSYRELSVDELMRRTGHTRTVFYRHFADLPDLVMQVLRRVGTELIEISRDWTVGFAAPPERGRENLARIVDFFRREGALVRAVADAASYDDQIERLYRQAIDAFVMMTAEALERRIIAGEMPDIDAPETARALTWMNERYLLDSFGGPEPADPDRVLEALWVVWSSVVYGPEAR